MQSEAHPLTAYVKASRTSLASIARKANCSRMTLYRVMQGENTTTALLQRISDATGGEVTVADFLPKQKVAS